MEPGPKQQIVERVRQANNILVTVSNNPSVDQLASCIGLTLMLNAMGKHATAVFSGKTPSTLEFLQPEKTLEANTDSLRDFIISLDKSKADKLRYKVEDQVVRIFITPYKTKISEADLIFSQGDFNVEVVIALGVKDREHIDGAIVAHGRILHDATVVSLNAGDTGGNVEVGSLNWVEPTASSLCEMIVSISEAFGSGLIDNQMATAFLTGIVAETERFSNKRTTPKVMTMSAQLMAAGANQQLIATKLSEEIVAPVRMAGQPPASGEANADVITIDHNDEVNIDEHGNLGVVEPPPPLVPFEKLPSEPEQNLPPPVEQPEPEPPKPEPEPEPEINTDTRGALPDRLPTGDNQAPHTDENSFLAGKEHKVIAPPSHSREEPKPESKISTHRRVLDSEHDPALINPFTANAQPQHDGNNISPLDPTHDPGILHHSKPSADAKADKPAEEPKSHVNSALEAIEQELRDAGAVIPEPADEDSARKAVDDVLKNAPYDADRPKPVESLNAQPVTDKLHNPPEVKPQIKPTVKMPELAIPKLTDLPDTLGGNEQNPPPAPTPDVPAELQSPSNVPTVSVAPDGTLKIDTDEPQAPVAPPPVPPPLTPPAK